MRLFCRRSGGTGLLLAVLTLLTSGPGTASAHVRTAPARLLDGSAPMLVMDESFATGPVVREPGGPIEYVTVQIRDSLDASNFATPPRDTVPARSRIEFRWHAESGAGGSRVVGYRYRLDEPDFVEADSSVKTVSYNTGIGGDVVRPGTKVFTLRVVDEVGKEREITRRFQLNYDPDTWFAGPDTTLLDERFGWASHDRSLEVGDWLALPDLGGSLLGCDSLTQRPAERAPHKTFFEIYRDRLYVRAENDTVHMNSWVIVHSGGADLDSPYHVIVDPTDPALADTAVCAAAGIPAVVRPDRLNGSPIGFRSQYAIVLSPLSLPTIPSQSVLFPNFDPASVFRAPRIGAYAGMSQSGKVYFVMRAADADGGRDRSVGDARAVAFRVDSGVGTPEEIAARRKILTFHVNQAPFLRFDDPAFVPRPGQSFPSRLLSLNLLADDVDPYDLENRPGGPGGPSLTQVLRWRVQARGEDAAGTQVLFPARADSVFSPRVTIDLAQSTIVSPRVDVQVELCDCTACELIPGSGRCVNYDIPIQILDPTATLASLVALEASPERVEVRWRLEGVESARVERRAATGGWTRVGEVVADGTGQVVFEDRSVEVGARYAYRLVLRAGGLERSAAEVWVDVPSATVFALAGLRPNPAVRNDLTAHFSIATAGPVRIEILDLSGRRVLGRDLGSLGPGQHVIQLGHGARIPPGFYLVRLSQGRNVRVARAAVLR